MLLQIVLLTGAVNRSLELDHVVRVRVLTFLAEIQLAHRAVKPRAGDWRSISGAAGGVGVRDFWFIQDA
jgi:hypothetical protein